MFKKLDPQTHDKKSNIKISKKENIIKSKEETQTKHFIGNGDCIQKYKIKPTSLQENKKLITMQIEKRKKKLTDKIIKVQQAKEQIDKERVKNLEIQYQNKLDTLTKQTERRRLAMSAEIQRKRYLAETRARDNETRRRCYLNQREHYLQALENNKFFGKQHKREQDHINRLDEIRLQEITAANARLQKQNINLNKSKILNYTKLHVNIN